MDIFSILAILIVGWGVAKFLASEATSHGIDAFAAGFLPYREAGWPRGVQEGEPIPWNWSSMTERGVAPAEREPAPDVGLEIIEIDAEGDAELTEIDRGRISGGTSIRPH
jgi:hypothetical protein